MHIVISRQKYRFVGEIQSKISKNEWIEAIESNANFTWFENSDQGREVYTIFPDRERTVTAVSEYDKKDKYFKIKANFSEDYGFISFDLPKVTKARLLIFLELSVQLNALLLKNGSKEIDLEFISALK